TFAQRARVDRAEADAFDQLRDHGLGLPIISCDEDCESVLRRVGGAGARLERLPAHRVEALHEAGLGHQLRDLLAGRRLPEIDALADRGVGARTVGDYLSL